MEVGLRVIGLFNRILSFILQPLYWLLCLSPKKHLPPITSKYLLTSATELARKIRHGEVTSEKVVSDFIRRIKASNEILNAVVDERFEDALKDARNADQLIASKREQIEYFENELPLLGVPVTIKESCKLKGQSYTAGSKTRAGIVADDDGTAVANLRKAGAIPLCVSNTPEYCLNWESNNLLYGRTLNPYDSHKTPGGSSGGEGALIGSGSSVIGVGSDIGGSIRIPAMFNGVFGHKPTSCLISHEGHFPNSVDENFKKWLTVGPIVRYAEDLKLMTRIMAGENAKLLSLEKKVDIEKLNVYVKYTAGKSLTMMNVSNDVTDLIKQASLHLSSIGARVSTESFVDMQYSVEVCCANFGGMENIPNLVENIEHPEKSKNLYLEILKSIIGSSDISLEALLFHFLLDVNFGIPRKNVEFYRKMKTELAETFENHLGDNGVLMYPTFPTSAYKHNQAFLKTAGVMYTMVFNILGLPATHVPIGLDAEGMPIGIQIIAGPHQDHLCFAVAQELEKVYGGWKSPCNVEI